MHSTQFRFDRRTFLRSTLCCGALVAAGACSTRPIGGRGSEPPGPCLPEHWMKHGLVLEPTEPWEGDHIQNFTTRAEPLHGDRWRIWYSVSGSTSTYHVAFAEGVPGEAMKKTPAVC